MDYKNRRAVMPGHLNFHNTLFGGTMMAWIDEEAAIYAACKLGHDAKLVTAHIGEINFSNPARVGDVLEFGMEVTKYGTSSITLSCTVVNKSSKKIICKVDRIVFVNIDAEGNPVPHGISK